MSLIDLNHWFVVFKIGTGKALVAASIIHNFDYCYGIELLEGLHSVSLELINSYNFRGKISHYFQNRKIDTSKM